MNQARGVLDSLADCLQRLIFVGAESEVSQSESDMSVVVVHAAEGAQPGRGCGSVEATLSIARLTAPSLGKPCIAPSV